jgi:BirA family biotin operon repressor/biotin-[acetyl-CoA-carboxylase] ligase
MIEEACSVAHADVFDILVFDRLSSTQRYLLDALVNGTLAVPVAVLAKTQYAGIGSRENSWEGEEGNFFASIAIEHTRLPEDLPLSSASIYFSFLMKKALLDFTDKVWLKWPNDLYVEDKKVGGTITKTAGGNMVCGIGINLQDTRSGYCGIGLQISALSLLKHYLEVLGKFPAWKQVFSEYQVEFELSRGFSVHIENDKKSLENAQLCEDGSLMIDGKRIYSLR